MNFLVESEMPSEKKVKGNKIWNDLGSRMLQIDVFFWGGFGYISIS